MNGQMISVRMSGAGTRLGDDNVVDSVGSTRDVVALAVERRLEVRR